MHNNTVSSSLPTLLCYLWIFNYSMPDRRPIYILEDS